LATLYTALNVFGRNVTTVSQNRLGSTLPLC
jgi:hypothetical protein